MRGRRGLALWLCGARSPGRVLGDPGRPHAPESTLSFLGQLPGDLGPCRRVNGCPYEWTSVDGSLGWDVSAPGNNDTLCHLRLPPRG